MKTPRHLLLVPMLWIAACCSAAAQDWPTATPESQGMDSTALSTLMEYGANVKMDSLVVARNGRIVAEAYYAPYRAEMKHRINSATKAVIGMLTGIAMARGEMPATGTPVSELLTEAAESGGARWGGVTIQHLLDMTSGIEWKEPLTGGFPQTLVDMERSRNWAEFILARPLVRPPGAAFDYNSGNSQLLSIALTRRTGLGTDAYASKFLFEPLGITDFRWRKDPQGNAIGGFGLYLHTRDMARLGQLYLQHGEWQGRQVVPRAWTDRVFAPRVDMDIPGFRYADCWWSIPGKRTYMMVGYNRQLVMVLPDLGIVAAMTGRANWPIEDVIGHLQRAARSTTALPDDAAAQAALRARVETAASSPPALAGNGVPAATGPGSYRLDANTLGVREIAFAFDASPPAYRMLMNTRELAAPLGLDGRFAESEDNGAPLFTRAAWQEPGTLLLEQRWPEEAASVSYVLKFSGDALEITRTNEFGAKSVLKATRMAQP